jgi:RNA polymerase sigma-70 factor (ECF subfamily)
MANTSIELQHWLDLLRSGDDRGRRELINYACERLRKLTHRMLQGFRLVRRWEQTDDVLQNALLRLYRALADVHPQSLRHFYNLATLQIRRELLDLAKHHGGLEGQGAKHHTDGGGKAADDSGGPLAQQPDTAGEPASLWEWTTFHQQVGALPDEEREVFNLRWYEGLSHEEAAAVLGVNVRTVKRRWRNAQILLYQALAGSSPGGSP